MAIEVSEVPYYGIYYTTISFPYYGRCEFELGTTFEKLVKKGLNKFVDGF